MSRSTPHACSVLIPARFRFGSDASCIHAQATRCWRGYLNFNDIGESGERRCTRVLKPPVLERRHAWGAQLASVRLEHPSDGSFCSRATTVCVRMHQRMQTASRATTSWHATRYRPCSGFTRYAPKFWIRHLQFCCVRGLPRDIVHELFRNSIVHELFLFNT